MVHSVLDGLEGGRWTMYFLPFRLEVTGREKEGWIEELPPRMDLNGK